MAVLDLYFQNGPETAIQSSIFEKTMAENSIKSVKEKLSNEIKEISGKIDCGFKEERLSCWHLTLKSSIPSWI
jgi:hypothetical protein